MLILLATICAASADGQTPRSGKGGDAIAEPIRNEPTADEESADEESADAESADEEDLADLDGELDDLLDADISSLRQTSVSPSLDLEVTSVTRQASTIGRTDAAVFVITAEMIRRSGYRTIPEVLRLAPGVRVSRINGGAWSIDIRDQGSLFSNRLLVQIDGRAVYRHVFAGTYWDQQDLLLDDIERIEVIRGPQATVWGANAVNGVINILTKHGSKTHGVFAEAGGGTLHEGFFGARVGGQTTGGTDWRVSLRGFQRDDFINPSGPENDAAELGNLNFRSDTQLNCTDNLTVLSGYQAGNTESLFDTPLTPLTAATTSHSTFYSLGRWTRKYSEHSEQSFQTYFDQSNRQSNGLDVKISTFDLDYQYRCQLADRHNLLWGAGYRLISDDITQANPNTGPSADPARDDLQRFSLFIQDRITLQEDRLYLTLGTRLSHHTYTQWQLQPTIRILCLPSESSAAWAAVSRGVRTPSRGERSASIPVGEVAGFPVWLLGNNNVLVEEVLSFEAGYRQQVSQTFSWDIAAFYSDLDAVGGVTPDPTAFPPVLYFSNNTSQNTYGVEVSGHYDLSDAWSLTGTYTYLDIRNYFPDFTISSTGRTHPYNIATLFSRWDVSPTMQFDVIGRYVDNLPGLGVPSYVAADLRMSWRARPGMELTLAAQNLLDRSHPEHANQDYTGDIATEVPRSVYGMVQWRY